VLVAEATERHRFGRNGIYDIRVTRDDAVVAEFRGRSRTIGGPVVIPDGSEE
jgi:acyl-CoA thioesterase